MIFDTVRSLPRSLRSPAYRRFVKRINFRQALDMYNGHTWLHDRRAYVEWLVTSLNFGEPHSTRQIEDGIEWGMDADSRTLVDWCIAAGEWIRVVARGEIEIALVVEGDQAQRQAAQCRVWPISLNRREG